MKFTTFAKAWRWLLLLIAWFGMGIQLYVMLARVPENGMNYGQTIGRFFLFFTVLSNLLVALSFTFILLTPRSKMGIFFSKASNLAAVMLYIFVVAVVYNTVLRSQFPLTGLDRVPNEIQHVIVPLMVFLHWVFFVAHGQLKWRNAWPWLIYPTAYLGYALFRGNREGFYPYPFLDIAKLGPEKVWTNIGAVCLVFLFSAFLLIAADRTILKRR